MYVEELIGPDTVNTMPEETIEAYQDHGHPRPRLESELDQARKLFDDLAAAGVDYDDVTDTLEREGVEKFADAFARAARSRWRTSAPRSRPPDGAVRFRLRSRGSGSARGSAAARTGTPRRRT